MKDRANAITMNENPLTLTGAELKVGDPAPDFDLVDNNMKHTSLKDFSDKILILSSVPSLDTPVCDMETRRFNMEAANLDKSIQILTISMDLPFAQRRWCGAAGVERVITLSDYQSQSFGKAYGVLIKELKLLSRAVFVVDGNRIIRHIQIVDEVTNEPDYASVLEAARSLV